MNKATKAQLDEEEKVTDMLEHVDGSLAAALDALEKARNELALEVGRNIKWQSMFEEVGTAAVNIASFVKRTYLTKTINIQELEAVYALAERIEAVMLSYQKRKDLVQFDKIKEEEVIDDH